MVPKKGEKAIVLSSSDDNVHAENVNATFKQGKSVFVTNIAGMIATCKARQSDLPSMCVEIPKNLLAKLAIGNNNTDSKLYYGMGATDDNNKETNNTRNRNVEYACEGYVSIVLKSKPPFL